MTEGNVVRVRVANKKYEHFAVDRTLDYNVSQEDVAVSVEDMLDWVLSGHEGCLISYGQLGAGKTHTMLGEPRDPGLLARSLNRIFMRTPDQLKAQYEEDPNAFQGFPIHVFRFRFFFHRANHHSTFADPELVVTDVVWSILQLCGDDVSDLLFEPQAEDELPPKLTVHMSKSRNRAFVRGAVHMRVDCFEDAMVCFCTMQTFCC